VSKFDIDPAPKAPTDFKVGEKGFGTCRACGKHTLGKSNDLCSRCGGTPVHEILGLPQDDLPHIPFGVIEKTFVVEGKKFVRSGYPARHYHSGPVVGRMP
jgi:hypothetical protein